MFLVGILSWWYRDGLVSRVNIIRERLGSTADFFSIGILIQTLFNPFRQISATKSDGPLNVRWQVFVDRTISRFIGAFMRLLLIILGAATMIIEAILGGFILVFWVAAPVLPVIGLILFVTGWLPWRI